MEPLFDKILQNGSPLAALCVIVFFFLRHMDSAQKGLREMMQGMHMQHLEARKETSIALHENAQSTRENTRAIQSLEVAINQIVRKP